jgi:hypothetical protein
MLLWGRTGDPGCPYAAPSHYYFTLSLYPTPGSVMMCWGLAG